MTGLYIALGILVFLALVLLAGSYAVYCMVFKRIHYHDGDEYRLIPGEREEPQKTAVLTLIKEVCERPYEKVQVRAEDGVLLAGKLYIHKEDAPVMILFHGYKATAEHDFYGRVKMFMEEYSFNVLLIDERGHHDSGGKSITFGVRESHDCRCWINYCINRFSVKTTVFLYGISMGAATVMMAAGLTLPANVKGIIADCGYTSPREILRKEIKVDFHLPVHLVYPLVTLGALLFGHFNPNKASAEKALAKTNIPLLIVHGNADTFVPYEMSERNFSACASENKKLLTVNGAGHALSYLTDTESYRNALKEFINSLNK